MRRFTATALLLAAISVLGLTAACGGETTPAPTVRLLTPDEQSIVAKSAKLKDAADYNVQWVSLLEALLTGGNNYKPIQVTETTPNEHGRQSGVMLFAVCAEGQTLQDCATAKPREETPNVYMTYTRINYAWSYGNVIAYTAETKAGSLRCVDQGDFQLNPDSIKQIGRVFAAFTADGKRHEGDMLVDLKVPENKQFSAQGKSTWNCSIDTTVPTPTPISY